MKHIYSVVVFLFGLFITIEIARTSLYGFTFYWADIFYIVLFFLISIILIVNRHRMNNSVSKETYIFSLLLLLLLLSTLNFLSPLIDKQVFIFRDGYILTLKYVLKTIPNIFFFILLLYLPQKYQCAYVINFIRGFLFGVLLHILYSIVQFVCLYFYGFDTHQCIFDFIGISENDIGDHPKLNFLLYPVIIRLSGLHWDPAYFGLWSSIFLFICLYTKRKFLFILTLIPWILSFSRTAYISTFLLIIFCFIFKVKVFYYLFLKKNIIRILCLFILIVCTIEFIQIDICYDIKQVFFSRFLVEKNDISVARHSSYPIYTMESSVGDIYHFIFGYGARNSSRAIIECFGLDNTLGIKKLFELESDWCKMLLNFGFPSFFIYIIFHLNLIFILYKYMKSSMSLYITFSFVSIFLIFICGISYTYNDSKLIWMIYFVSILILNNKKYFA